MRATLTITWLLLLSLSFLFHTGCSDTAASVTGASAGAARLTVATGATPAAGDVKNESTQAATSVKPNTAVTIPPTIVSAQSTLPTAGPANTTQASTITDKPASSPSIISGNADATPSAKNDATPSAATTSLSKPTTISSVPAGSSGSSVVSHSVATTQMSETTVPTKTPTIGPTGHIDTVGITKVSTEALTTGKQPEVHTTITSKTSQDASSGATGTEKITVTATSHMQTASRATEPAGTTTKPSAPTSAGPPAAETFGTKAGTSPPQTTPTPSPTTTTSSSISTTTTTTTTTTITTEADQQKMFSYSLNNGHKKEEEKELAEVCRRLMVNLLDGNCSLTWRDRNGKIQFDHVEINGKVKTSLAAQYYEEISKKPTDNKTLIAILASCGALLIMIVILAVCASHHRKPYNENQQHLTEELHTVENGYHDNPTLEVMEVQPEMQEKKMALNGEFNDSWIVPIDNLLKEDIPDEEDTHL